jgi:hypothetical protein
VHGIGWMLPEANHVGAWIHDDDDVRRLNAEVTSDTPRLWWRQGEGDWFARGWIGLSRPLTARLSAEQLVALLAHECGHVAARLRDFHVRDTGLYAEWASEACADRLAFRWGFEREIRADAPHRSLGHHGVLPGEVVWVGDKAFRVDRHFIIRPCPRFDGQAPALAGPP